MLILASLLHVKTEPHVLKITTEVIHVSAKMVSKAKDAKVRFYFSFVKIYLDN